MSDKTKVDVEKTLAVKFVPYKVKISAQDAILYNLAIGFQRDQVDTAQFRFSLETDDDFAPFATNALVVAHRGRTSNGDFAFEGLPEFNPMMLLHGEEKITVYSPLQVDTEYNIQEKIVDFQDKGKGALMIVDSYITDVSTNKLQSLIRSSLFLRGLGGFGHKGTIKANFPKPPKRAPDMTREEKTELN